MLCMAAALMGRDSWRYTNVAVIAGTLTITFGALLNRVYLRELLLFRGAARRADSPTVPAENDTGESKRMRIR
jgi:hypothetical protein